MSRKYRLRIQNRENGALKTSPETFGISLINIKVAINKVDVATKSSFGKGNYKHG